MKKTSEYLINPFRYIAGWESVAYGAAIMVAAVVVASFTNTHFPDVLSLKIGVDLSAGALLLQWAMVWAVVSITMYVGALFFSPSRIRLVDFVGTQGMARFPYLIGTFIGFSGAIEKFSKMLMYSQLNIGEPVRVTVPEMVWAVLQLLLVMGLLVWLVALMYKAFAVSANLKGGKAVAVFTGALVASIAFSMTANWLLWPVLIDL